MAATFKDVFPPVEAALAMPPEELAVYVLQFLRSARVDNTGMVNRRNFTISSGYIAQYAGPRVDEVAKALTEAWMWLEREGLIAPQPDLDRDWVYVTKRGEAYQTSADVTAYRHQKLLRDHPLDAELVEKVIPLFRPDDYDTPVYRAYKIVEVRVRRLAQLPEDLVGVKLIRAAFDPKNGKLTDYSLPDDAEREAMSHYFAGAIGLFRNPSGHRDHVKTAEDAAKRIIGADLLLTILAGLPAARMKDQANTRS